MQLNTWGIYFQWIYIVNEIFHTDTWIRLIKATIWRSFTADESQTPNCSDVPVTIIKHRREEKFWKSSLNIQNSFTVELCHWPGKEWNKLLTCVHRFRISSCHMLWIWMLSFYPWVQLSCSSSTFPCVCCHSLSESASLLSQ